MFTRLLSCRNNFVLISPSSILDSSISIRSGYGTSQISQLGASLFHGKAVIHFFWEVGRISKTFGICTSGGDIFQWSVRRRIRGSTRFHQIPGVIVSFHYESFMNIYPQAPFLVIFFNFYPRNYPQLVLCPGDSTPSGLTLYFLYHYHNQFIFSLVSYH